MLIKLQVYFHKYEKNKIYILDFKIALNEQNRNQFEQQTQIPPGNDQTYINFCRYLSDTIKTDDL